MPTRWRIISLLLIATLIAAVAAAAFPAFSAARPAAAQACGETVVNGGFETNGGWVFSSGPTPPQYVSSPVRSGSRSLQLGIAGGPNQESYSSARQTVTIAPGATSALLTFWWYPSVTSPDPSDWMELLLLSPNGSTIWSRPWSAQNGAPVWNKAVFDLTAWRGQTFQIYFNVRNDGFGGTTAMYLDDVSLSTCGLPPGTPLPTWTPTWTPWPTAWPTSTPTWTPWPTAWPTPWPTPWPTSWPTPPGPPPIGCVDLLVNGSFDAQLSGWTSGMNPLPAAAVPDPVLSPPFAAEMGASVRNLNSYSSIRQTVTVPFGYDHTYIGFWTQTFAESLADDDWQEFVLLGPGNVVWATPWKVLESSELWQQHLYEVIGAPGPAFDVYFAAINDGQGGRAVLRVDDAHVWACAGSGLPPADIAPYGATDAVPMMADSVDLTSEAPVFVVPEAAPEIFEVQPQAVPPSTVGTPEPVVTPQVVPFETLSPADARGIEAFGPVVETTPVDVTGLPQPEWTEVVIGGQPLATVPAGALPAPTAVPPPESRGVATASPPQAAVIATALANPSAILTQAVSAIETVAPSPTRPPFGLLSTVSQRISERTAQWPIPWQWVLGIVLVVILIIIWFVRRRRND